MPSRDHVASYYAATANQTTDFPVLRGEHNADVCVIGAGFTGISTALHLAERGYSVHVVEANRVGWGASGRNGGQMIGGISGEEQIAKRNGRDVEELFSELRWAGHDIIRERVARYGIDCDLKFGYADVVIKPRHLDNLQRDLARLQASGFPHEARLLSRSETREVTGSDVYTGALLNMANGHLHPLNLCIGEALAAATLGTVINERSPVIDIAHGSKAKVLTAEGSVSADFVVIAGNAYHELDKRLCNLLLPVNSFIVATQPLAASTVADVNPMDIAICDPNYILEYFRLSADKRLLFGGRCRYFGSDPATIEKQLRPRLERVYPQLAGTRIDYAWGGTIGVPLNRVPQMGRIAPNVVYCQGYSGHGVNVAHLTGRILADAIAGTVEQFDLFAKAPSIALPGLRRFRRPLISLGMLLYGIRDRL